MLQKSILKIIGILGIVFFAFEPAYANNAEISPLMQKHISDDYILRLIQSSTRLRQVGIVDVGKVNDFFAINGQEALDYELTKGAIFDSRLLWSSFFRNSQIYLGNLKNPKPVVGFYNPIVDFWLLTVWDNKEKLPSLISSYLVPASYFYDKDMVLQTEVPALPFWMTLVGEKPLIESIPQYAVKSTDSFEALYPSNGNKAHKKISFKANKIAVKEAFHNRLAFFFASILAIQKREDLSHSYALTLDFLAKADTVSILKQFDGPTKMPVQKVTSFPKTFRTSLEPSVMVAGKDFEIIISSKNNDGRWFLVTAYKKVEKGKKLEGIAFLDVFANAGKGVPK